MIEINTGTQICGKKYEQIKDCKQFMGCLGVTLSAAPVQ